ncbi:hypothetical protein ACOMHN_036072 [Nucella lapillus]
MARPTLPQGYMGPQGKFHEWGMATVSHNSPEIQTNTNPLTVRFRTTKPVKVTANLTCCKTDNEHKELIFTQTEEKGNMVSLIVLLPSEGFFKLQIFALLVSDETKSLPNVYNYLIHSTAPAPTCMFSFPKQFAQWKDGCNLVKPYHLNEGDTASFEVSVPKAKNVAVTVGKEWYPFKKDSDDVWRGEVKGLASCRGKGVKAVLNANFDEGSAKYTSLLEYPL